MLKRWKDQTIWDTLDSWAHLRVQSEIHCWCKVFLALLCSFDLPCSRLLQPVGNFLYFMHDICCGFPCTREKSAHSSVRFNKQRFTNFDLTCSIDYTHCSGYPAINVFILIELLCLSIFWWQHNKVHALILNPSKDWCVTRMCQIPDC